jgi:uncharacterized Zn finger protein (UPF0148 family)
MFENLIRELDRLQKIKLSIPIETDEEGYFDKECPSEDCHFQFKVLAEDWNNKISDASVFCPLCGRDEPSDKFWTSDQLERAKRQVLRVVKSKIRRALEEDAEAFNRRQPKNGFIRMKMEYRSGSSRVTFILPLPAKKEFELKISCTNCGCKFSVLGSAFYCPCCGHSSVSEVFDNSIRKVEGKINNLEVIRKAVSEISADAAELTVRSLIESSLSECVVAFQRFCEMTYKNVHGSHEQIKPNAFQNLEIGDEYWREVFGESFMDWISDAEYKKLNLLFQKRHLLAHCEGIVDERYIQKSGDSMYKAGQRIVVGVKDVLEMVGLIKILVSNIRSKTI